MEKKIQELATAASNAFQNRCSKDVYECSTKSISMCEGTSDKWCNYDFPETTICDSKGTYIANSSGIRFPTDRDTSNLSDADSQFACLTATLEDEFKKFDEDRNGRYTLAYIGGANGMHRRYPGSKANLEGGLCMDYDPRYRPWYVSATTGPKNIIIIIDTSGSMDINKLISVKTAVKNILTSLSNVDFVGVVAFNENATKLYSDKIERATKAVKEALTQEVEQLESGGITNYISAFTEGLNMIKQAANDEGGAPCANAENVILFLTDGAPSNESLTASDTIDIINEQREGHKLKIFTYGMGSDSDTNYDFLR